MFESALVARHESAAADSVADDHSLEPTRSVLHRSAASIALQMFDTNTARRYAETGLKGKPPEEIREELEALSEQITILDAERADYRLKAPASRTPVQFHPPDALRLPFFAPDAIRLRSAYAH
jgi:hypothetical protein